MRYPQIHVVATTLREVCSTNRHRWSAAWIDGDVFTAPTCELDVHDRVGGGDGFAAGFFYGLLAGEPPVEAPAWMGARALHDVSRRHDNGERRRGARPCSRSDGPHSTLDNHCDSTCPCRHSADGDAAKRQF